MQSSPSQAGDFCWGDFASKGFSDEFDSDTFSLFSDVGRPSMDEEASIARGPQKLKKPYPYASLASRHMQFERCYYAERDEQSNAPVVATIKEMKMVQVDPIFLEVYLDSLESPTVTSKWPVFAVAELKSTYLPCNAVVVEVENAKPTMEPQLPLFSTVAIPSSPSENDKSVAKQKRGLFSLGSRKKRPPIQETDKEPPESSDRAEKARFDEFGKRISVKSAAPSRPTQGHSQTSRSPRPFSTASTSREKRRTSTTTDSGPDSIQISEFKAPIRSSPKPDTIAEVEETPEDRSTPSPSGSKSSTGRKLSRKPVPLMADEEAALSAEVTEAADTARECNIAEVPDIIVAVPQADSSLDAVPIPPPSDYSSPVLSRHTASDDEVVAQVKDSQNNQQSTGDPHSITGNASVPVVIISHEEDDEPSSRLQEAESNALEGHTQDAHPAEPVPNVDDSAVAADTKPGDNDQEIIASEPFVDGQKITSESIDEENRMESLPASAAPARQNADEAEIQDSVVSETEPEEVEAKPAEDIAEPVPSVDADTIDDIKRGDTDMNASGIEQSASTPKRFGSTLNRVSPSLKERFGSSNKTQTTPEQAGMDSSGLKAQPPPSPSRRAALLSGAKKMLTRRKSAPLHSDSVVTNKEVEHPPLPRVVDIPILATDALAETQTAAQDPNNASEASIASSSSTIEPEEGGLTSAAPQSNTVKHGDVLLPSVGPAESEETPDGFPSATETDSHHQDGGSDGLKHATTDTKHVEVADLTSLQSDDATSIEHAIVDSQSLDENRGHSSTEPTAERLESDSSENPVPEVRADLAETEDIRHTPEDSESGEAQCLRRETTQR